MPFLVGAGILDDHDELVAPEAVEGVVAEEARDDLFNGTLLEKYYEIPMRISPGPKSTMRCCIYKERAIVLERMKLALGGNKNIDNVVEVIKFACDECPLGGYEVTNRCRGCIGGPCSLTHEMRSKLDVDKYGHESKEKTIIDATKHYQD